MINATLIPILEKEASEKLSEEQRLHSKYRGLDWTIIGKDNASWYNKQTPICIVA